MSKYKKRIYICLLVCLLVCFFCILLFWYLYPTLLQKFLFWMGLYYWKEWGIYITWKDSIHIWGINLITYLYLGFIFISVFVFFVKKSLTKKLKLLFYIWLWLFLIIWILNAIDNTLILNQWLNWFKKDMSYFDLLDYYWFVDKARTKLDLDFNKKNDCKFLMEYGVNSWIETFWPWPIEIYFKPCELALPWDLVDYKIYYKKEIPEWDLDKKVLLEFNGSYLLENNSNKCLNHHYYYF